MNNFEFLKRKLYQLVFPDEKNITVVGPYLLLSRIGVDFVPFMKDVEKFKHDFNDWLDRMDIRQTNVLIDKLIELKVELPGWMKSKQYSIEYNEKEELDLIPLNKN